MLLYLVTLVILLETIICIPATSRDRANLIVQQVNAKFNTYISDSRSKKVNICDKIVVPAYVAMVWSVVDGDNLDGLIDKYQKFPPHTIEDDKHRALIYYYQAQEKIYDLRHILQEKYRNDMEPMFSQLLEVNNQLIESAEALFKPSDSMKSGLKTLVDKCKVAENLHLESRHEIKLKNLILNMVPSFVEGLSKETFKLVSDAINEMKK